MNFFNNKFNGNKFFHIFITVKIDSRLIMIGLE